MNIKEKIRFEDLFEQELVINDENPEEGIFSVALTSSPRIEVMGVAFNKDILKYEFKRIKDQQIIAGPFAIPNLRMVDYKPNMGYYKCYYSEETVKKMQYSFIKNYSNKSLNVEHDSTQSVPGIVIEHWIIENPDMDKSRLYGFNLPKGTWFALVRIEDKKFWNNEVKDNQRYGFSIDGKMSANIAHMDICPCGCGEDEEIHLINQLSDEDLIRMSELIHDKKKA